VTANEADLAAAASAGMSPALLDRLRLTGTRLDAMAAETWQRSRTSPGTRSSKNARTVSPCGNGAVPPASSARTSKRART
jgi:hypothetical protein